MEVTVRHRLGRFEPKPGSSVYDSLDLHPRRAPLLSRALQEMLRVEVSAHRPQPAGAGLLDRAEGLRPFQGLSLPPGPDLLTVLRPGHPDRVWVVELKDALEELTRRLEIRLLACEYEPEPDGYLAITGISPSVSAEVREHDPVRAGFVALRDRDRPLVLAERIFRVVHTTGAILPPREEAAERERLSVEERVDRCFDRDRFLSAVAALRAAAGRELHAIEPALDGMSSFDERGHDPAPGAESSGAYGERVSGTRRDRVEAALREGCDPTVYGLVNAVASVARDLPDVRERLELEALAGTLARWSPATDPRPAEEARAPAMA
jgi:hypothetical protein